MKTCIWTVNALLVILQIMFAYTFLYSTHTVFILFVQVLKRLKSDLKNPADTQNKIK